MEKDIQKEGNEQMEGIIREDKLLKLCNQMTFVKSTFSVSEYIALEGTIESFIEFCKNNDIFNIFYCYRFYDGDEYIITDDMLKDNTGSKKEYLFCKKWADKYNERMQSYDFYRPEVLMLVAVFENVFVAYREIDQWLEEDVKKGKDALCDFQDEHVDEIVDFYDYDEESDSFDPYYELENKLLSDKNFRYATNKAQRRVYMKDFLKKEGNKKYLLLFRGVKEKIEKEYRLANMLDQIYYEYRNKCYKLKIQVGEELPTDA